VTDQQLNDIHKTLAIISEELKLMVASNVILIHETTQNTSTTINDITSRVVALASKLFES